MSYSSMTLKNVMGGCELVDLKPLQSEKSLLIDLSLIGVNLHDLQKNLISNMSHNQNNTRVESVSDGVIGSEIRRESSGDQSKNNKNNDNNNNNVCSVQQIDDKVIESITQLKPAKVQCNLELFDFNENKVVKAEPSDLPQPVFTSIQNFYETFDVSDQTESMMNMESIADTPSSASTIDSSNDQDLVIYETNSTAIYHQNFEVTSDVTSTEDQYEFHFITKAVSGEDSTHPLVAQNITKGGMQSVDTSNESSELKEKKRKRTGRVSRKKPGPEKNVSCSRCSKKFRTEAHLKVHFMVHLDSECVHRCTVCERRFCHRGALTLHARMHAPRPAFGIP